MILTPLLCFASGTGILTSRGEVAVEDLAVGDLAVTASGEARPIAWIGHRRIQSPSREQLPVRVMAGAFGENRPARDLLLSPGHAVCVDVMGEVFVLAGELVNGATIAQVEVSEVTYWHVELESHDVLLADGLPCESYLDRGNRAFFGHAYGRLDEIDPERLAESLTRYARPLVAEGPLVAAIRERLAARAEAMGWTRTADLDLHLLVDGARLEPEIDGDLARFIFPAAARDVRLASRSFVPAADRGGDTRRLGINLQGLHIGDGLRIDRDIALDRLGAGCHALEGAGAQAWRWTDGAAALPAELWADCRGLAILRLAFRQNAGRAWLAPETEPLRAVA